jgi:gamma-glutamyltranspeptidase/glutathione hydrolase
MSGAAVASSSQLAADVGAGVARAGGNAVDTAITAALTAMTTEPGVCALGACGFVTVGPDGGEPVTIEGHGAMPGLGLPPDALNRGAWEVELGYGGGVTTLVGFGSVAVPGAIAALGQASRRYGRLPWRDLVLPVAEVQRRGFPLPRSCRHYLDYSAEPVFGWDPNSRQTLRDEQGRVVDAGTIVTVPGLATSLEIIAEEGPESFYRGELGHRIADYVSDNGGALNRRDMAEYEVSERPSLTIDLDDWAISTTPSPAVGGATLAAMLLLMRNAGATGWTPAAVARCAEIQREVLAFRRRRLDASKDLEADIAALLESAAAQRLPASADTVHTSAVDDEGNACSITMSSGYGSGVLPTGTGCWLNNSVGEIELNPGGAKAIAPGERLSSNMAPTVARRRDGKVLAAGSPGADRITTAIFQMLVSYIQFGMSLAEAVSHARLHVEETATGYRVAVEPGLATDEIGLELRHFEEPSMFFGGVGAATWSPASGFAVAGDPRRQGGTAIVHGD